MATSRVLFGFHAITARLRTRPDSIHALYMASARQDARARDIAARAQSVGIAIHAVDDARLLQLAGHGRHQGIVALVDEALPYVTLDDVLETADEPALLVVLDGVTDPHNLGACLRCADAFGAHAIVVPKDRAVGVAKEPDEAKPATPYLMVTNLARTLAEIKERNIWVVGADERAEKTLHQQDLPESIAWVLGAEGEGMRRLTRESCDILVRIPMQGEVESLNVSVATGICLYATRRARAGAAR